MPIVRSLSFSGAVTVLLAACGSGGAESAATPEGAAATPPAAAPAAAATPAATPLTAVAACSRLTLDDLKAVYPSLTFAIETENNYPPTPYEALSGCRYHNPNTDVPEDVHVDLQLRVKPTAAEALKQVKDAQEMDPNPDKGRPVADMGDAAYFSNVSMAFDGPVLTFAKGPIVYKLNIQTIKRGVAPKLEGEILALAGKILARP